MSPGAPAESFVRKRKDMILEHILKRVLGQNEIESRSYVVSERLNACSQRGPR